MVGKNLRWALRYDEGQGEIDRDMYEMFGIGSRGEGRGCREKRGTIERSYNDIDNRQYVRTSVES